MDFFKMLKEDHAKTAELLERLQDGSEEAVKTREEHFARLSQDLGAHAYAEEKVLYPTLKHMESIRDAGFEAVEEHHIIKILLGELDALPKGSETWAAKLAVLKETLEHHVREEETTLFPKAREMLTDDEMDALGERAMEEKQNYLRRAPEPEVI